MMLLNKIAELFRSFKKDIHLGPDQAEEFTNTYTGEEPLHNQVLKALEEKFVHSIHEVHSPVARKKINFDTIFVIWVKPEDLDSVCAKKGLIKDNAVEMFYHYLKPYEKSDCKLDNLCSIWSFNIVPIDIKTGENENTYENSRVLVDSTANDLIKQIKETGSVTLTDINGSKSSPNLLNLNLDLNILEDSRDTKTYWVAEFNPELELTSSFENYNSDKKSKAGPKIEAEIEYVSSTGEQKSENIYSGLTLFGNAKKTSNDYIQLNINGLMSKHFKIKFDHDNCFLATRYPMDVNGKAIPISTFSSDNWVEIETKSVELRINSIKITLKRK